MTARTARHRTTSLTALAAALTLSLPSGPAWGYEPPGGLRDVREFACPPGSVPDAGFGDVPDRDRFTLEINCLASLGISRGTGSASPGSERTFAPAQSVPRFAMASFLARTLGVAGVELPDGEPVFTDLDGVPAEAVRAIEALARVGVVRGITETQFAPRRLVTREQLATFVVRTQSYLAAVTGGQPFPAGPDRFTDGVSNTHRDAVQALAAAGIVQGTGPSTFAPTRDVTRSQMAAYLTRYVDRLDEADPDISPLARNNELLSGGITAVPAAGSRPAITDRDRDNDLRDDTVYTVSGLVPGREYRITLVTTESFRRAEGGPVDNSRESMRVVFSGSSATFLPDPGTTSAVVLELDGMAVEQPSRSVTHTPAAPGGTLQFRVDAEDATAVTPFIYPNQSYDYTSYDPRLELADDLRPVEVFGVGPAATYTAPTALLSR